MIRALLLQLVALLATFATPAYAQPPAADNASAAVTSADSIDKLADVDTTTVAPDVGDPLEWDGSNWTPGVDGGGAGTTTFKSVGAINNATFGASVPLVNSPCYRGAAHGFAAVNPFLAEASCFASRAITITSFYVQVMSTLGTGEDCRVSLQSGGLEIAGSVIQIGPSQTASCDAGSKTVDTNGEFCRKTLSQNLAQAANWRVLVSAPVTGTCTGIASIQYEVEFQSQ